MKVFNIKSLIFVTSVFLTSLFAFLPINLIASSGSLTDYLRDFPYIGLVLDEIQYGPVTISKVHIHHSDKIAVVSPGEILEGSLKYKIKTDHNKFDLYHLIVGIEGVGAQDCIAHSFNLWNTRGKGKFTLVAPTEPGVYQVRFLYKEGLTCSDAKEAWNSGDQDPSSAAMIGIIVVK